MAKKDTTNTIILTSNPKGVFLEGLISGTPKPGTCLEVKPATAMSSGRPTFQAFQTGADGSRGLVAVLLEDDEQGKLVTDAYVTGTRCRVYCPVAGEELMCIRLDIAGTADDQAIGDLLMIDAPTGKLIANSSGGMIPFIAMEAIVDPTADTLTWVMYTGH